MQPIENDISSSLRAPPDTDRPRPPVETRVQCLPMGELSWENFERLCYRLVGQQSEVEHCARYGVQGEAQEGSAQTLTIGGRIPSTAGNVAADTYSDSVAVTVTF